MCTSFAVYGKNSPIYGMNFDSDDIDLKLSICKYDEIEVFYFSCLVDHIFRDCGGFNSNGLFIYTQALEFSPNFKPGSSENSVFFLDVIEQSLKTGNKVSDFLAILNGRNVVFPGNPLFPDMGLHTLIADKYGDAIILEAGTDTNIISKIKNPFIVMTNFPNGDFENKKFDEVYGCGADRYIEAYKNISDQINHFGIKEASEVLRKTCQDTTICSIVLDPLKLEAYVSFKIDFEKKWKVSMKEKTIQTLDGFKSNSVLHFTPEGINANKLFELYE